MLSLPFDETQPQTGCSVVQGECQPRSRRFLALGVRPMSESAHGVSETPTLRAAHAIVAATTRSPLRQAGRPQFRINRTAVAGRRRTRPRKLRHRAAVRPAEPIAGFRDGRRMPVGDGRPPGPRPGCGFSLLEGDPLFELQRAAHLAAGATRAATGAAPAAVGWLPPSCSRRSRGRPPAPLLPLTPASWSHPLVALGRELRRRRCAPPSPISPSGESSRHRDLPRFRSHRGRARAAASLRRGRSAYRVARLRISAVGSLFGRATSCCGGRRVDRLSEPAPVSRRALAVALALDPLGDAALPHLATSACASNRPTRTSRAASASSSRPRSPSSACSWRSAPCSAAD